MSADPHTSVFSPFVGAVEPITESDDEIRQVLASAEIPPMLPALAYATGDMSLLREDVRPDPLLIGLPQGGMTENQLALARQLAFETLVRFRDQGSKSAPVPDDEALLQIMEFCVGAGDMRDYLPMLEEELAILGADRRAPDWQATRLDFSVVIVGAGMSGLLVAHRLQQAGVPFVVVEMNEDVGGTWFDNSYPGCRVDNPNHTYSYSFAQRHDWPYNFSTQPVLLDYFRRCAETFGLREHIWFDSEVVSATWSDERSKWTVEVRSGGETKSIEANAVVSAVGQLNRPAYPAIPGRETFSGPSFHSARWRHDLDLRGKRVAVIGTGASAVQFIPEIAPEVGELLVFQRTPPWFGPDYHDPVSPGQTWLYGHVPSYSEWNRFWIFWRLGDGVLATVRVDEDFEPKNRAVSESNDFVRLVFTDYITGEFADRPDLLAQVLPTYPPGAKRILRDNGSWGSALKRDNVRLFTDGIREITPLGLVTLDGVDHPLDVIIYGTGFEASKFLTPMTITGRRGVDLHEHWNDDARAYLGITVPGFPNLFCLYGPNTNIVLNGSIVFFSECGVRYVLGCLKLLQEGGHHALEVRKDVHDQFNEATDAENRQMAWGRSNVNTWYKNGLGRVAQNWPFTLLEYWQRTLAPDPEEFQFLN